MKNIRLSKINNQRGLTLIELMVALAIFLVVLIVVTSIFLTAIKNQRKAFVVQNLQDNARYIIETISKEIRMSEVQTGSNSDLRVINQDGNEVWYRFQSNQITRREKPPGEGWGDFKEISSSKVNIVGQFYITNEANSQAKVTIVIKASPAGASEPQIQIQNTITSRKYRL